MDIDVSSKSHNYSKNKYNLMLNDDLGDLVEEQPMQLQARPQPKTPRLVERETQPPPQNIFSSTIPEINFNNLL